MKWTTEPPTEPGWYWKKSIWRQGFSYKEIVHLHDYDITPVIMRPNVQWAGPIPEPEEEKANEL